MSFRRYVGKCPIAIIVIKDRPPVISHQEITKAVVVVIPHGRAHSVALAFQSCLLCNIPESAVMLVSVEAIPEFRRGFVQYFSIELWIPKLGSIDKKHIQPSIIVIVENC